MDIQYTIIRLFIVKFFCIYQTILLQTTIWTNSYNVECKMQMKHVLFASYLSSSRHFYITLSLHYLILHSCIYTHNPGTDEVLLVFFQEFFHVKNFLNENSLEKGKKIIAFCVWMNVIFFNTVICDEWVYSCACGEWLSVGSYPSFSLLLQEQYWAPLWGEPASGGGHHQHENGPYLLQSRWTSAELPDASHPTRRIYILHS